MSWNIHHGNEGLSAQVRLMATTQADVIALQEVTGRHRPEYVSELTAQTGIPWHQAWAPVSEDEMEGNLVLSRHAPALTDWRRIGASSWGGDRTAALLAIDLAHVRLHIVGTHLDTNRAGNPDTSKRTENLRQLLAWTAGLPAPCLVLGDFNCTWDQPWIAEMKRGYTDTWEDVTGAPEGSPTFPKRRHRIDYVFRSCAAADTVRPTAAWVIETELSDHYPMMTDFEVGIPPA